MMILIMHTYEAVLTANIYESDMAKDQRQHIQRVRGFYEAIQQIFDKNGMLIIFQREHGFLVLFSLPLHFYVVSYVMRVSCF